MTSRPATKHRETVAVANRGWTAIIARTALAALLVGAGLTGCASGLDPEGVLEADDVLEEELWDEGPPEEEAAQDAAGKADDGFAGAPPIVSATTRPNFQVPFPCGQTWSGQTRTNHSPLNSIDFNRANDLGDAVVASAGGTVSRVENLGNRSYGRWIEIDHGGGWRTRYAHLSSQAVSVGQRVRAGQRIGAVGSTGGSSGPHLHYEQRLNGVAVRIIFNGSNALYFGTRSYSSRNACGGGGGGGGATAGVKGRVDTAGPRLTVRTGPGTNFAVVGSLADGTSITIRCQKRGQTISGMFGTTNLWDFVGNGYVSDAYVFTGSDGQVAPTCQ